MHGPVPGSIQQRREAIAGTVGTPISYDKLAHEVTATLSKGSPVQRAYGVERLEISEPAIDLSRLQQGGIPLLDHHQQNGLDSILGKVTDAWVSGGALVGRVKFAATERGQLAEGMIARCEIGAVSVGYRVTEWEITDQDGKVIDPERDRVGWDESLKFLATRWQLFEVSLVGVPADGEALVRGMPLGTEYLDLESVRARMRIRHRMLRRHMKVLGYG
jgi:phage head maturation protease